jgi:hypothetical protein
MPGLALTMESASAARVPLPFGLPRRPVWVAPRLRVAAVARAGQIMRHVTDTTEQIKAPALALPA